MYSNSNFIQFAEAAELLAVCKNKLFLLKVGTAVDCTHLLSQISQETTANLCSQLLLSAS